MAVEITGIYEAVSKYPRWSEADGIRWAHLLIDGTVSVDYFLLCKQYGHGTAWSSGLVAELVRMARHPPQAR